MYRENRFEIDLRSITCGRVTLFLYNCIERSVLVVQLIWFIAKDPEVAHFVRDLYHILVQYNLDKSSYHKSSRSI